MNKSSDVLLTFEFEYRLFISLLIVLGVCCVSIMFYSQSPSVILIAGQLIGIPEQISLTIGFLLVGLLAGCASFLRIWAGSILSSNRIMSFSVRAELLYQHGPYRCVRNPIYLADLVAVLGFALCFPPVGLLMPALLYLHYLRLIAYEEESFRQKLGREYSEYVRNTPRLIPSIRSIWNFTTHYDPPQFNRDGVRYNALYLLFIPGFMCASITHHLWHAVIIGLPAVLDWGINHTKIGLPEKKKSNVFDDILYAQCWEDPQIDRAAYGITADDVVFSITSGGCNTLTFLLDNPREVIALDINRYQNYLLELKMACFTNLPYDAMLEFIGVRSSKNRRSMYQTLRKSLSPSARAYWDSHPGKIDAGIIHCGRFERYLRLLRIMLSVIVGKKLIRQFFDAEHAAERIHLYEDQWNGVRWRIFTRFMLSRTVMSMFFDKAFFAQLEDRFSFGENFAAKVKHALTELPVRENYFLSYMLLGRYYSETHLPVYLRKENYEIIRDRIDRIRIVTNRCEDYFAQCPDRSISKFNFTNIFEWLPEATFETLMKETIRVAEDDAILSYRNLLVPRRRPESLATIIIADQELAATLHKADLSFIYNNYVVEKIQKDRQLCHTELNEYLPAEV